MKKKLISSLLLIILIFSVRPEVEVHNKLSISFTSIGNFSAIAGEASSWTCLAHPYASYCVTPGGYTMYYHFRVGGTEPIIE